MIQNGGLRTAYEDTLRTLSYILSTHGPGSLGLVSLDAGRPRRLMRFPRLRGWIYQQRSLLTYTQSARIRSTLDTGSRCFRKG